MLKKLLSKERLDKIDQAILAQRVILPTESEANVVPNGRRRNQTITGTSSYGIGVDLADAVAQPLQWRVHPAAQAVPTENLYGIEATGYSQWHHGSRTQSRDDLQRRYNELELQYRSTQEHGASEENLNRLYRRMEEASHNLHRYEQEHGDGSGFQARQDEVNHLIEELSFAERHNAPRQVRHDIQERLIEARSRLYRTPRYQQVPITPTNYFTDTPTPYVSPPTYVQPVALGYEHGFTYNADAPLNSEEERLEHYTYYNETGQLCNGVRPRNVPAAVPYEEQMIASSGEVFDVRRDTNGNAIYTPAHTLAAPGDVIPLNGGLNVIHTNSSGILESLVHQQEEINRHVNEINRNSMLMANPVWSVTSTIANPSAEQENRLDFVQEYLNSPNVSDELRQSLDNYILYGESQVLTTLAPDGSLTVTNVDAEARTITVSENDE